MTQLLPRLARQGALAAAMAIAMASGSATAAPLDDIRRQVEASQFEQAYATAQANPQLIGDVHFDFLYGVAAINVGRVPEGLLALERHLAAVPANDRARLELARGYFLLGDYTRARSEFEFVLRYNPPPGVRSNIEGFLRAMQTRDLADRRVAARLYFEGGFGHDSNVNGGTFRDEVQLVFGNINLSGSPSKELPDNFAQVAMGGQQQYRVSNRTSVFAGADLDVRVNAQEHDYDLTTGGLNIGFSHLGAGALWRSTLALTELRVGANRYRDTFSVSTEANVTLSADQSMTGFFNFGEMRYATSDEVRDSRVSTLGAMFTQNYPDAAGSPSVGVRLSYSQEDNLRMRPDLSRTMPLLRLFGSFTAMDRLRLSAGLTGYQQKFGGQDIGFGTVRLDKSWIADLSANYAISNYLSLRADGVWSGTQSNQDLYDSQRNAVSIKLRYQY